MGYSSWGGKESDMTERLMQQQQQPLQVVFILIEEFKEREQHLDFLELIELFLFRFQFNLRFYCFLFSFIHTLLATSFLKRPSTLLPERSGEGNGNPLQWVPGKSHGQRSLVGYSSWGSKDLYTTE